MVTEYADFGAFGTDLGFEVDGSEPCGRLNIQVCPDQGYDFTEISQDRDYERYYIKSNQEIDLTYFANIDELNAYWVVEGPTDWNNVKIDDANSNPYLIQNTDSVTATFCQETLSLIFDCNQGATWNVSLYLYNDEGHGRKLFIQVVTDDVGADSDKPDADFQILWNENNPDKTDSTVVVPHPEFPTKEFRGKSRNVYQIILPDDINSDYSSDTGVWVYFDASLSQDLDWVGDGSGIKYYEWKVANDYPIKYSQFKNIRVIGEIESPDNPSNNKVAPFFQYQFFNVTSDRDTTFEDSLIWFDLIVYDNAMNPSDTTRIYFQVVSPDLVDEPPQWEFEDTISCGVDKNDPCTLDNTDESDNLVEFSVTLTDGIESGGVLIEASTVDPKTLEINDKANMLSEGTYMAAANKAEGDVIKMMVNISGSYGDIGTSNSITIYLRIAEGSSYDLSDNFTITLQNNMNSSTGDGDGTDGTNTNAETQSGAGGDTLILVGGVVVFIVIALILTLMFVRGRGDSDMDDSFGGDVGEMDAVEAYVQQLVAQGYPEETARTYAQAAIAQQQQQQQSVASVGAAGAGVSATAVTAQPSAQATNPKMEAYVQQLIAQGYPEAQARSYAMQFADRFK